MSLHIGFTKTYYTLWSLSEQHCEDSGYQYTRTTATYKQNLSKDLSQAQIKAAALGCSDLEPDKDLRGKKEFTFDTDRRRVAPFKTTLAAYQTLFMNSGMAYNVFAANRENPTPDGIEYLRSEFLFAIERLTEAGLMTWSTTLGCYLVTPVGENGISTEGMVGAVEDGLIDITDIKVSARLALVGLESKVVHISKYEYRFCELI